jgi:Fe-S-cluster-containing hydrogenase component 2
MVDKEPAVQLKRLYVTPGKCIGCRTCELACTFVHTVGGGRLRRTRVQVHDTGNETFVPVLCLQCETAACVLACPVEALVRNEETGAIEVDEERCVRCMACVVACPFGNMLFDEQAAMVVKCDVCTGRPACAMFCPTKALEYR